MTRLVVDASVTLAWCLKDEAGAHAVAILKEVPDEPGAIAVPAHWPLEVASGLLVAQRRGRMTAGDAADARALLWALPLEVVPVATSEALGAVSDLAREHGLTSYDAAYLELALRTGAKPGTLDDAVKRAATAVGVELA